MVVDSPAVVNLSPISLPTLEICHSLIITTSTGEESTKRPVTKVGYPALERYVGDAIDSYGSSLETSTSR